MVFSVVFASIILGPGVAEDVRPTRMWCSPVQLKSQQLFTISDINKQSATGGMMSGGRGDKEGNKGWWV